MKKTPTWWTDRSPPHIDRFLASINRPTPPRSLPLFDQLNAPPPDQAEQLRKLAAQKKDRAER